MFDFNYLGMSFPYRRLSEINTEPALKNSFVRKKFLGRT